MATSIAPKLSKYAEQLSISDKRRYLEKVQDIGDPYIYELSTLKADSLPPVRSTDIYNYLVLSTSFCTGERFKAYKGMDSYRYFASGFVSKVGGKVAGDYFVVVGNVRHSQKANDPLLNVWIKTDMDGVVMCAHCDCMAGLGEVCSHVGAILFYVESAYRVKSCTEVPCAWNMPTSISGIPYARIADIDFVKPKSIVKPVKRGAHCNNDCDMLTEPADIEVNSDVTKSSSSSCTHRVGILNPNLISTSEDEANTFFNNVLKHNPCVLSLISPYCDSYIPNESKEATPSDIPGLSSLYKPENEELTYKELIDVGEDVVFELTSEQISKIEEHTRAQQGCDLWFKHRAGRITASKMKTACHTDPAAPSISLIKQICYPKQYSFSTSATRWGCNHEDIARQVYFNEMQQQHSEFDCFCGGLIIDEEYPFIAATPDGYRQCACCGDGVVEIKCPFCAKDSDPELSAFLKDGHLPCSHQYYYQVQTQMLVCRVEFADFVVCTFPDDKPTLYIERIEIDWDFVANCIMKSGDFYKVAIMPELLGRWFTRSAVLPASTVDDRNDDSQYRYCYCKQELGGQMIHCDNINECPYGEWFHLSCLKLKNVPRVKKWYCPQCRKHLKKIK